MTIAIFGKFHYTADMPRRNYPISITINQIAIRTVIIDDHYEEKHSSTINDELILKLVQTLDQKLFEPVDVKPPYSYFVTEQMEYNHHHYKLIWLLEEDEIYIGVVNAYRRGTKEREGE